MKESVEWVYIEKLLKIRNSQLLAVKVSRKKQEKTSQMDKSKNTVKSLFDCSESQKYEKLRKELESSKSTNSRYPNINYWSFDTYKQLSSSHSNKQSDKYSSSSTTSSDKERKIKEYSWGSYRKSTKKWKKVFKQLFFEEMISVAHKTCWSKEVK